MFSAITNHSLKALLVFGLCLGTHNAQARDRGPELDRKIEVCGKRYALWTDSVSDFSRKTRNPFPGYAKILWNPHEALLAKLELIRGAKKTIQISTYIFHPDPSSLAILDELRKAIRNRGVSVQVVVDSSGSLNPSQLNHQDLKSLFFVEPGINPITHQKATVDVVIFNPLFRIKTFLGWIMDNIGQVPLEDRMPGNFDRRMHDKLLLVDSNDRENSRAVLGGRNLTDSYYGVPQIDGETYEDMEILVADVNDENESREDLESTLGMHFKRLICHKSNDWLNPTLTRDIGSKINGASKRLEKKLNLSKHHDALWSGFSRTHLDFGNEIENIRRRVSAVFKDPNRDRDQTIVNGDSIIEQLAAEINRAENTIDIVSPYIYLSDVEKERLINWVKAKPHRRLRIISNSMLTSDNLLAQTLVDTEVAPSLMSASKELDGRIQFYEFGRLDSTDLGGHRYYGKLHAKYAVVDGRIGLVTSSNGDPRSRYLNSEIGMFFDDERLGQDLQNQFNKMKDRSYLWGSSRWEILIHHPKLEGKHVIIQKLKKVYQGILKRFRFFI